MSSWGLIKTPITTTDMRLYCLTRPNCPTLYPSHRDRGYAAVSHPYLSPGCERSPARFGSVNAHASSPSSSVAALLTTAGPAPCGMQYVEYARCVSGTRRSSVALLAPKAVNELRRKDAQVPHRGRETPTIGGLTFGFSVFGGSVSTRTHKLEC